MTCPPEHRHGETAHCYQAHSCRCERCVDAYSERRRGVQPTNALQSSRRHGLCNVCKREPVEAPRVTCEGCVAYMMALPRTPEAFDSCHHGHPWTPENTRKVRDGRECRECSRIRSRARSARLRAMREKA
jgi:hypothetical protein